MAKPSAARKATSGKGESRSAPARKGRPRSSGTVPASERKFQALIQNSSDIIAILDEAATITYISPSGPRLLGYSEAELVGRNAMALVHPDDREHLTDELNQVVQHHNDGIPARFRLRHADGNYLAVESLGANLMGAPGIKGVVVNIRDISERVQAEEALRQKTEELDRYFQNSLDLLCIADTEGRFRRLNPVWERTLGYPLAELIGRPFMEFVHPEDVPATREAVSKLAGQNPVLNFVNRYRCRDGSYRWIEWRSSPLGQMIYAVARDITDYQEAQVRLRESEERWKFALEGSNQGVWDWDMASGKIFYSTGWKAMLGYADHEIGNGLDEWAKRVHPDDREASERALQEHVAGRSPYYENEHRIRTKSGSWKWILDRGKIVDRRPDGTPLRMIGTHTDITDRRRIEETLRKNEEIFRTIYTASPIGIELYDASGIQIGANPASLAMFGIPSLPEVQGFNLFEGTSLSAENRDRLRRGESAAYHATFDFDRVRELNQYPTARSGRAEMEYLITPLKSADHQTVVGYLLQVQDVTERRGAEQALRDSESRFSSFMEYSPSLVLIKDADLRPIYANRLYRETFPIEQWLGRLPEECFPPEVAAEMRLRDREAMESGYLQYEEQWGNLQNRLHHFNTQKFRIDRPGLPPLLGCIITDISDQKRAEAERLQMERQMLQAQKLESLGVLAGGIAHDFNNLLTAILGNLDLARLNLSTASPAWRNLEQAQASTLRAADLARQMLAYSGKGRFVIEPLPLNALVEEMAHMLQVSISKKALLRFHLAPGLPAVEADATQMRQVIMNLVINASDAIGDQSGVISLATGSMVCDAGYLDSVRLDEPLPEGRYVFVEVSDTGCGIDEAARSRIFDPFYSTKFTGRGLGLAAVLGIVRGHRGAIKVYSEVGKGSTFKILLPASTQDAQAIPEAGRQPAQWRGHGTVLLADDEPGILEVGREMLQRLGFTVLTAADGREAIDIFKNSPEPIRLIILDLTMPHMDGEESFRELRRLRSDARIMLSSGYNEQEVTQRFVGRGLAGFIQKPYQFATLRQKLMEALEPTPPSARPS